MNHVKISALDRAMAKICGSCPVCRRARARQKGVSFLLVQRVEARVCPFCRAYEKVHGKKAHEPA
ncbi:MAG TPA: hypothetical protein VI389_10620 [Geobacteraceae bacterium]